MVSQDWWASLDYQVAPEAQGSLEGKERVEGLEETDSLAAPGTPD